MIDRLSLDGSKHPNFMGCWMLENSSLCDDLIGFFERNKDSQNPGVSGDGKHRETVKKSTDITISPRDLEDKKLQAVSTYVEHLKVCYLDYLEQWNFLKNAGMTSLSLNYR